MNAVVAAKQQAEAGIECYRTAHNGSRPDERLAHPNFFARLPVGAEVRPPPEIGPDPIQIGKCKAESSRVDACPE
uniref:Uncharacterized protein n=1 Tax=Mycena chlorophos TaxID=658473 RepID=A0ABQ0LP07_MYCCL|nr:predicted protein [Mycena chlorophos]